MTRSFLSQRAAALVRVWGDSNPVATDWELGHGRRIVSEPSGRVDPKLAKLGEDVPGAAVLNCDPSGNEPVGSVLLEFVAQPVVPAERRQIVHC